MKTRSSIFILLIALLVPGFLKAQTKFEREYRIREQQVPENAVQFVKDAFDGKKIKWYAEESQDGTSVEAKVKYRKHKFSVEFDTTGTLLDVEKTVKFKSLDPNISGNITESLAAKFGDYKILKVQVQWTSSDNRTLKELIRKDTSTGNYQEKYEIVIETRENKAYKAFEVLTNREGTIEKSLEMVLRSINNMEF